MTAQQQTLSPHSKYNIRQIKDRIMSLSMGIGGISVIIAIVLIFFYLLYVVFPMFIPADMERAHSYPLPSSVNGETVHLSMEEQNEIGLRFTDQGKAVFFNAVNGETLEAENIYTNKYKYYSFAHDKLARGIVAYGLNDGSVVLSQHKYQLIYGEEKRTIKPKLLFPFDEAPIQLNEDIISPVTALGIRIDEEESTIAGLIDGQLIVTRLTHDESPFEVEESEEPVVFEKESISIPSITDAEKILISGDQRLLFVVHASNEISMLNISDIEDVTIISRQKVATGDSYITNVSFLTGEISLLVGDNTGQIAQWFPVSTDKGLELTKIRSFESEQSGITSIVAEQRRKGFAVVDEKGQLGIYHSTAQRTLLNAKAMDHAVTYLAVSPRANAILMEDDKGNYQFWKVENEHPDTSWQVLWQKVWYESYEEPKYIWQSSSSSNDFEPKFSLMPLAFGTLKAAFYAMLFAVPLAIMGAIYTAYFMSPLMRGYVKPTIEIMEALPTVILGFLAGLWLAPAIETNLAGVFAVLFILPISVLVFAYVWQRLPKQIRKSIPDGWHAALLIPVIFLAGWFALSLSPGLESVFFDGDMKLWLENTLGLDYDQRNSLVVGIAMGIAVIPTIFSITEDAIFSVPKHLTFGSLALGATPWQTLIRVVILTASPGIFSAVMIGMGRAVGETMIVLMATGNTPVMDMSIFQGMRSLAANIAVEMPESEVDSTHYRVLFLAALVLFIFTFMFNTLAELVRQRLRKKYSSL